MSDDDETGLLASSPERKPKDWCFDGLRLFDWYAWVTKVGDNREVVSGIFGLVVIIFSLVYVVIVFVSPSYSDTTALCTCQSLDNVPVIRDADNLVLESFPDTHLVKLCADHGTGQICSNECLAESNHDFDGQLCDAGTFSCTCVGEGDAATCNDGLTCQDGLCVGARTSAKGGNSVAVRFCEEKLQAKIQAIQRLVGLTPQKVILTEREKAILAEHSRCVVGFDACQIPNTVFAVLGVIGSTWGWATLFIIPAIMCWNCGLKLAYLKQHDETRRLRKQEKNFFEDGTAMKTMKD